MSWKSRAILEKGSALSQSCRSGTGWTKRGFGTGFIRHARIEIQAQGSQRNGDKTGKKVIMTVQCPSRREDWRPAHLQQ